MYILQVTPIIKLPGILSYWLSYSSTQYIAPGTIVSVEVRSKHITGIVIICQEMSNKDLGGENPLTLKPILQVFGSRPLLTAHQLQLSQWMTQFYAFPLGMILKLFLPKITPSMKRYPKVLDTPPYLSPEIDPRPSYASYPIIDLFLGRISHYQSLIEQASGQVLLLVPDKISLARLTKELASYNPLVFSGELGTKHHREAWMQIKNNQAKLILATRSGTFLPFHSLALIIVEDESSEAYYSFDMKPRYQTQDIVQQLAKIYNVPIYWGTHLPSIRLLQSFESNHISIPESFYPSWSPLHIHIVSMSDHYANGLEGPLSEVVIQEIRTSYKEKSPVVLLVNRRGESTYIYCEDCGHHLRDPYSGSLLVTHKIPQGIKHKLKGYNDSRVLVSHKSQKWFRMVYQCPQCGSDKLYQGGLGIEKIASLITKAIPELKVSIVSRDHTQTLDSQRDVIELLNSHQIDLICTTQMIHKFWSDLANPVFIIPSGESLLGFPEYMTLERAIHTLSEGFLYAKKVIIQSFEPWRPEEETPPLLYQIRNGDIAPILYQELRDRQTYHYPPFYEIIALRSKHGISQKALDQSLRTKTNLSQIGIRSLGPLEGYDARGKGRFVWSLILKANPQQALNWKKRIIPILEPNQEIEINPPNLT